MLGSVTSCLDQIFTNCDHISNSGTLDCSISDHIGVFVTRKKLMVDSPKINFEGCSYRNYDKSEFQKLLIDENWVPFYNSDDPNECWKIMANAIVGNIDIFCPVKPFKVKAISDPWITNELLEEIRDKDHLLRKAKRTKIKADWDLAKSERNRVGRLIESARANYFREEHIASLGDPKRFWRNINSVLPKCKGQSLIDSLVDQTTDDNISQDKAAGFINSFFANIGPNLAKDNNEIWSFAGVPNNDSIQDFYTDYEQVHKLCREIDITKSAGLDNMSSKFLKDAFLVLVPQLVYIFNLSLHSGCFPNEWKIAKVVPLLKGGDRGDVGNYKPISLLPVPGKMLERIVHTHVSSFLENTNVLCERQGGFRKGHSTTHSIADLTDDLFNNINGGKTTLAVFIDLKKAFDTINHEILIKKLNLLGIKGQTLNWLKNYLHNRH